MKIDSLQLSDLLARRVNMEWYEAIAIVRGVVARLLEDPVAAVSIPELHQIELCASGLVVLTGGATVKEPVRRLGQLLQAIPVNADLPVQLRLVISQATAPLPSYASLSEFDEALAYFERPDRQGVLGTLFARAQAAPPAAEDGAPLTLDRIAPLANTESVGTPRNPDNRRSRWLPGMTAAVFALLILSGAAALYLSSAAAPGGGRQVSHAAEAAADKLGTVVLAGVSALSDTMGMGLLVAANSAQPPLATSASGPPAPDRRARTVRHLAHSGEPAWTEVENLRSTGIRAYDAADASTTVDDDVVAHIQSQPSSAAPVDLMVYGPESHAVLPPIAVYPQLPRGLPLGVDSATLSRIELVIARDGTVESARVLGNRPDIRGGMLLSAAKTWQFQPAVRDGVAVRYRKTILVSFE